MGDCVPGRTVPIGAGGSGGGTATIARRLEDGAETVSIETEAFAGELTFPQHTSGRDDGALLATLGVDPSGNLRVSPRLGPTAVEVVAKADFPAPAAGVITLAAKTYVLRGLVDLGSDRIEWAAGAFILGLNPALDGLTTSNAGAAVTLVTSGGMQGIGITNTGAGKSLHLDGAGVQGACINCIFTSGFDYISGAFIKLQDVQFPPGSGIVVSAVPAVSAGFLQLADVISIIGAGEVGVDFLAGSSIAGFGSFTTKYFAADVTAIAVRKDATAFVGLGPFQNSVFTPLGPFEFTHFVGLSNASGFFFFRDNAGTPANPVPSTVPQGVTQFLDATARTVTLVAGVSGPVSDGGVNITHTVIGSPQQAVLDEPDTGAIESTSVFPASFLVFAHIRAARTGGASFPFTLSVAKSTDGGGTFIVDPLSTTPTLTMTNAQTTFRTEPLSVSFETGDQIRVEVTAPGGESFDVELCNLSLN